MTKNRSTPTAASGLRLVNPAPDTKKPRPSPRRGPLDAVDKDALTADIRTGILSWAEIGRRYGVSEAAIRQWAKRHLLERGDLQESVRNATRAMVSGVVDAKTLEATTSDTVVAAASAQLAVVMQHRADLQRLREVHAMAMDRLATFAGKIGDLADAGKFFAALEAATRATRHLIEKERQAHGISDDREPGDDGALTVVIRKFGDD